MSRVRITHTWAWVYEYVNTSIHNTVDTDNIGDTVLKVKLGSGAECIFTLCLGSVSPVMFNP